MNSKSRIGSLLEIIQADVGDWVDVYGAGCVKELRALGLPAVGAVADLLRVRE